MALSIVDRLLGRTESVEAKAVTGPGAFAMSYHTPLHALSRDPQRMMAEAQGLFHSNGWVAAAERALGGLFVGLDWHLEDADGETVDDSSPENEQQVLALMARPSTKSRSKLWGVTFRHLGLCGNAFWYLDQREPVAGTPLSIMYINPARMTPATDEAGNVTGWVLDHPDNQAVNSRTVQARTGTPLTTKEVIHFTMDEPDWGVWGIGIAESAQRKIELDKLTDLHAGGVLGSGGRLSGLVSPKAGATVNDDQWVQFVRDWRSITSDPDAAKRLQIAKMPLDFTQMTASLKDLQFIDIQNATQDDILAMWGVPKSIRGMDTAAGLNADRSEGDKETAYNTVKERSEPFRESVQLELLDRFQALGVDLKFIIDYPNFDEDTGAYENATKSKTIPLTVDEHRGQIGLDPLDEVIYGDLGRQVFLESTMVRIDKEPEPTPPQLLPFTGGAVPGEPEPQPIETSTDDEQDVVEGKADLRKPLLGLRSKTETTWEPKLRKVIAAVLGEQSKLVASKLEHATRKNDLTWWSAKREDRRFMEALDPVITDLAVEVAGATRKKVGKPQGKADSFLETVTDQIRRAIGERITGINATTRDKIAGAIAAGMEAGEGPAVIGLRIQDTAAFGESRAELISRTETMNVYNDAALRSYGALDVEMVEAIDGDVDEECANRNGQRYPIDEALGISDHPNGTLDWIPVAKAAPDPLEVIMGLMQGFKAALEGQPVPIVNVPAPVVNVPAPVVNVAATDTAPISKAITDALTAMPQPEAKATLPTEVIVTQLPNRVHRAVRGADGKINGSVEEDV